ncbi:MULTISPECIES: hypothetical protein [unclassified Campylobacter]|uniref:hypothetical protein n=1 Tax=unclassified Campylobacter TaxID=2593542 RepID=UPI0022E998E2|nr:MULTISPECIES: hypothetical protein [unclassified Campylobacter]MDA3054248.1 hypothetical protein [Campylobacter sp. VBCF_07 NA4]MDA3060939.1 hypothetical protein [Campylobacter sp. VBCF_02 NA5]MDA3061871.1 hypothetical protein [Campylobacter sp. JMF_14 EL1]MDA3070452.1 hypothetical protein [Campylobacter sp. VBCF_08 NA3]MDA3073023.1 hypothetical protein [Campylobacter sp. JMF_10 EL2]
MEKLKENLENNQNLDETINSENNKEPFIISNRNPLYVFIFSLLTGFMTFGTLFPIFLISSITLERFIFLIIFIFSSYAFCSTIFFEYAKSYNDRIVIKKYFFKEFVIYRKDIIDTRVSSNPFVGNIFSMFVKRKIGIRFFAIFCLADNQCYGI